MTLSGSRWKPYLSPGCLRCPAQSDLSVPSLSGRARPVTWLTMVGHVTSLFKFPTFTLGVAGLVPMWIGSCRAVPHGRDLPNSLAPNPREQEWHHKVEPWRLLWGERVNGSPWCPQGFLLQVCYSVSPGWRGPDWRGEGTISVLLTRIRVVWTKAL